MRNIKCYETTDYSLFRRLKGNRDVTNKRVAIIKESIKSVGYISNPIIVNEKMEIIDGQGRVEALKQLEKPVEYRVVENIGIDECRAMNLKPTGWKADDFIKSYAEYGNENYKRLLMLKEKYDFDCTIIIATLLNSKSFKGTYSQIYRDGSLKLSAEECQRVSETLEYLSKFKDVQKKIKGRKEKFYTLIAWIYTLENVDRERLCVSIHQQYDKIMPVANSIATLRQISEVYNRGYAKNKRIYFEYLFNVKG